MLSFRPVAVLITAVFALTAGALFALPIERTQYVKVEINNVPVLAQVASTPQQKAKGLGGRKTLPQFGGMLFAFEKPSFIGIWMKQMKFPIDILWIANGRVVDMEENVPSPGPRASIDSLPIYKPDVPAEFVLEVGAGFARTYGIRIGDEAKIAMRDGVLAVSDPEEGAPPAGYEYFIETLRKKAFEGKDLKITKLVSQNKDYRKFEVMYSSGDFNISGVMNIPEGEPPTTGFPVLILNHGLISTEKYVSGQGSKREQDFFTKRGYITVHPDYRGHASSSPATSLHHDFYAGYTEDVVNLLEALERLGSSLFDLKRVGMWGHSMGGGIASRVMVLRPEIKAYVLFAPISAEVEDNFFELAEEEVLYLRDKYGQEGDQTYKKISPLTYFSDVVAPVQLHHGTADDDVPIAFSEKAYAALKGLGKKVEFYRYPGEKHEFIEGWQLSAERALQFFDRYVKNSQ